jgi:hypothetical protein
MNNLDVLSKNELEKYIRDHLSSFYLFSNNSHCFARMFFQDLTSVVNYILSRSLQEGAAIRLYNVKVKPQSYLYKATTCHAVQLFFKAVHENMKTVYEPDDDMEYVFSIDIYKNVRVNEVRVNKIILKLFSC